jgi:acyl dehydratase
MALARQIYLEAIRIGDELTPLVKPPIDRVQLVRYAGASGDFNPVHVDETYARGAGFPGTFAPGMLVMGFISQLANEWARGGKLVKMGSRFVKIAWPGDVITCRGRILERHLDPSGRYLVDVEVWAENQRGELVQRGNATVQLYYSAEDEQRQKAGQGPLVVTKEQDEARQMRLARGSTPRRAVTALPMPTWSPARPAPRPVEASKPITEVKSAARVVSRPAAVKRPSAVKRPAAIKRPATRPAIQSKPKPKPKPTARSTASKKRR